MKQLKDVILCELVKAPLDNKNIMIDWFEEMLEDYYGAFISNERKYAAFNRKGQLISIEINGNAVWFSIEQERADFMDYLIKNTQDEDEIAVNGLYNTIYFYWNR